MALLAACSSPEPAEVDGPAEAAADAGDQDVEAEDAAAADTAAEPDPAEPDVADEPDVEPDVGDSEEDDDRQSEPADGEPPWAPGDADEWLAVAFPSVIDGGRDLTDWLDCRNPAPIADDLDYLVGCDIPVDGQLVGAWLFDWTVAMGDAFDDPADSGALAAATLAGFALLDTWADTWCELGIDRSYIVSVAPNRPIAFPWPHDPDELRYAAASQVASWTERVFVLNDFDHTVDVDVRRCET